MITFSCRWVDMRAMVRRKCNDVTFVLPVQVRCFCDFLEVLNMLDKGLYTYVGNGPCLVQVIVIICLISDDDIIFITMDKL